MSLLNRIRQYFLQKKIRERESHVYLQDGELIAAITDVAKQQRRTEQEVFTDFMKAGLNQFLTRIELENCWDSLSHREQQVTALICLGYRNYEIAQILVIAPETVKTYLQRIFDKFHLRSSKELRFALKDWNFREWWENKQQI